MDAESAWGARWEACDTALQRRWMEAVARTESLVVLAADLATMGEIERLLDEVAPHIAALKTHVDLVDDWNEDGWRALCAKARDADVLIMEDRKFADIGKVSRSQMAGRYDIRSWADLVTSHMISGPDVIDGITGSWDAVGREGGVLLLAQMSSRGNLLDPMYTERVVAEGCEAGGCFGFIGNGSRPDELRRLRLAVGDGRIIWTPGINISVGDGELGQRYGDPEEAVLAGSDGVIVGSGIHSAGNPVAAAEAYASASWLALLRRSGVTGR